MSEEIKVNESTYSLDRTSDLFEFGKELKKFIKRNNLSSKIAGNEHVHADGWKFAGSNFGLTAIPNKPIKTSNDTDYVVILFRDVLIRPYGRDPFKKETPFFVGKSSDVDVLDMARKEYEVTRELIKPFYSYECECDIVKVSDGVKISSGTGICSNMELSKCQFDEYAVNSTSQTRSIGKGYRNVIGFVMNEAGYESTPAEEMSEEHLHATPKPKRKKNGKPEMSASQVKSTMMKINAGDISDLSDIEKYFDLNEDQVDAFTTLFSSKNKE